jgi:hypothetical protein
VAARRSATVVQTLPSLEAPMPNSGSCSDRKNIATARAIRAARKRKAGASECDGGSAAVVRGTKRRTNSVKMSARPDDDAVAYFAGEVVLFIHGQQEPGSRTVAAGAVVPLFGATPIAGSSSGPAPRPRPVAGGRQPSHAGPFCTMRVSALTV